jgi:hypothetical protein
MLGLHLDCLVVYGGHPYWVKGVMLFVQWNQLWAKVRGQSDVVQHNAKVGMESGGLPVKNTCLRAGRSYYSSGLGCAPMTISTLGRKWGGQMT